MSAMIRETQLEAVALGERQLVLEQRTRPAKPLERELRYAPRGGLWRLRQVRDWRKKP